MKGKRLENGDDIDAYQHQLLRDLGATVAELEGMTATEADRLIDAARDAIRPVLSARLPNPMGAGWRPRKG
jgi:hypothetical protein